MPLPSAILDPEPGAHRCLIHELRACRCLDPDLGASRRLDPGLGVSHRRPLSQAIDTIALPPSSSSNPRHCRTTAIDLNPGFPWYQALNYFSS
jgi:hypothetical protein